MSAAALQTRRRASPRAAGGARGDPLGPRRARIALLVDARRDPAALRLAGQALGRAVAARRTPQKQELQAPRGRERRLKGRVRSLRDPGGAGARGAPAGHGPPGRARLRDREPAARSLTRPLPVRPMQYALENALYQWEQGERRVARRRGARAATSSAPPRWCVDELRRRLGSSFALRELVDLYAAGTDWAEEIAGRARAGDDAGAVVDAAFGRYAREAADFAGGGAHARPMASPVRAHWRAGVRRGRPDSAGYRRVARRERAGLPRRIGAGHRGRYFGGCEHVGQQEGALRGARRGAFGTFIRAREVGGRRQRTCPSPVLLVVITRAGRAARYLGGRARGQAGDRRLGTVSRRPRRRLLAGAADDDRSASIVTVTGRWPAQCSA